MEHIDALINPTVSAFEQRVLHGARRDRDDGPLPVDTLKHGSPTVARAGVASHAPLNDELEPGAASAGHRVRTATSPATELELPPAPLARLASIASPKTHDPNLLGKRARLFCHGDWQERGRHGLLESQERQIEPSRRLFCACHSSFAPILEPDRLDGKAMACSQNGAPGDHGSRTRETACVEKRHHGLLRVFLYVSLSHRDPRNRTHQRQYAHHASAHQRVSSIMDDAQMMCHPLVSVLPAVCAASNKQNAAMKQ